MAGFGGALRMVGFLVVLLQGAVLVRSQGMWHNQQQGGYHPPPRPPAQNPGQRPGYYPPSSPNQPQTPPGQRPGQPHPQPQPPPRHRPGQPHPQPQPQPPRTSPAGPVAPTIVKFLILGAGAAGLQAAETLVAKGETDFLVLEAADTYGGRIRDVPFAGARVEVGADAPRPKSSSFDSNVRGLGARMRLHKPDWMSLNILNEVGQTNLSREALRTHAWPRMAHTVREGLNLAEELWESHDTDMSVRAAFRSIGWYPATALQRTLEWLHFDYYLGDEPRMASLKSHAFDAPELTISRGPNADPHRVVTDQRGFKSFFDATMRVMQDQSFKSKILFNQEVTDVDYGNPNHVTATTRDGSRYQAQWAICTFSLGVLQNKVVKFTPGFPGWKTRELNRFVMGAHTRVLLEFPYTFWANKEFVLRVSDQRGNYPLFVDMATRIPELRINERHVLMAELTGDEARRVDSQPRAQTVREIMQALRRMSRYTLPDPLAVHVSGWNSDPRTMGSSSLWSPALDTKCFAKVQSRLGRLLFAGEHTSLRYCGHVQGALESGQREGDKAYLCSTGGTCPQWSEGVQCACTGTSPPMLHGDAGPRARPLGWALAAALLATRLAHVAMNI